jgi:hypothetical protein
MAEQVELLTPVGRLVQGSISKGQTQDAEGNPLVVKTGPNAGNPRTDYFFAVAIPKAGERHWNQTEWGKQIWQVGQRAFPQGQANSPTFAWKIVDGDSEVPNRRGRKPCEREGFPGHWVLSFSSGYAPNVVNSNGTKPQDPGSVKLGYYVQILGSCSGNGSVQQPGVYLNHNTVALSGYGPEITVGPDLATVGFGKAPLPAGASATPLGGMAAPDVAPPWDAASGVQPHPGFLAPPVTPPVPVAPPAALPVTPPVPVAPPVPAAPVRRMTEAAAGATYEQLIGAGWTDQLLVQHGMMHP